MAIRVQTWSVSEVSRRLRLPCFKTVDAPRFRLRKMDKCTFEQRETNLMSLALLFHYLMLNMFRMLIHPLSGACDLFVELFHGLYYSGSMCGGVTLWFGWGGVVWYPYAG